MTLRPAVMTMVIFAVVLSPMWLIGLWNLVRFSSYGPGTLLVLIPLAIWVYGVAGVRVTATERFVEMRRLFWREWRLETPKITIREGTGGDIPILPACVLEQTGARVRGTIVKVQFQRERLDEFLEYLVAHGATRR